MNLKLSCLLPLAIGLWLETSSAAVPSASELPVQTTLPDPLVNAAGQKITTAAQWQDRRAEMRRVLEDYAVGHLPPPPGNVTGTVLATQSLLEGQAEGRYVHLAFGPEGKLGFDAAVFIPTESAAFHAPFPTVVQPVFLHITGPGEPGTNSWETAAPAYAEQLRRGYAVMIFYYQQCGIDKTNYRASGFFPAYPDYDWSELGAWAWSMSRCVDWLETQPFADKTKFIAVGHSRLGKTVLVAGAFDERFALTAPAGSGCGGTGAYRFNGPGRGGKQGLEDITKRFPQWFNPQLATFAGQVEKLPFDQHWFMALTAPRLLIATDGANDPNTGNNALIQSCLAARPVYAWLGVPENLGVNFRPGGHRLDPEDWRAIMDFADEHLRGLKVDRKFDDFTVPPETLHR